MSLDTNKRCDGGGCGNRTQRPGDYESPELPLL